MPAYSAFISPTQNTFITPALWYIYAIFQDVLLVSLRYEILMQSYLCSYNLIICSNVFWDDCIFLIIL